MSLVLSRKDQEITSLIVPPSETETVITMQVVRHGERAQRHAWTAPRCVRIMRTELGPVSGEPNDELPIERDGDREQLRGGLAVAG